MGLSVTWPGERQGDKMDIKMMIKFVQTMLTDPNISNKDREKAYRDMFSQAKEAVFNEGSRGVKMREYLEKLNYTPE